AVASRSYKSSPGSIVFAALAPFGLVARPTRPQAWFYALVIAISVALSLDGPVLHAYLRTPLGSTFRYPERRLWIASFSAALLTALGAEALVRVPLAGRVGRLLLLLGGAGLFWALGGTRPPPSELYAVTALALFLVFASPRRDATDASVPGLALAIIVALFTLGASQRMLFAYVDGRAL